MPVHLVFQCALSELIESIKIEGNPAAVREKQTMEANYQPFLILAVDCRSRADHPRSTGN